VRRRRRLAHLACVAVVTLATAGRAAAALAVVMTTVAGNGRPGATDGPALAASFDIPVAVAVGADGAIYVADAGAQNIRVIREGRVSTLAGRSGDAIGTDVRAGGYADGAAAQAAFDRPVGIAVAKDGAVYVADAANHCIRKIQNGLVSTFAGSTQPGSADGTGTAASFSDLKALAIDADGTLYAADYGVGIRKISPRADVTTLALPSFRNTVVAIAARGSGRHVAIAYADEQGIHEVIGERATSARFDDQREPESSGLLVGYGDALAIFNENTLVASDVATHAVRFIRLPAPPYVTDVMTRGLAGGIHEGGDVTGGFADGGPDVALVNTPLGLALAPDGSLVLADAGNRRIRRIAGVDPRESVLPDGSNLNFPPSAYRIALVGNSYLFYDVLWPESIPGRVEAALERDAPTVGLSRKPYVTAFRIDGLTDAGEDSLIANYLANGQTDLVVLFVNSYNASEAARLRDIAQRLQAAHTKFMLVYTPQGYEVSPLEYWKALVARGDDDFAGLQSDAEHAAQFYGSLGIHVLELFESMEAQEALPVRRDLFYSANHHLTVYGAGWVGAQLVSDLERWQPWR